MIKNRLLSSDELRDAYGEFFRYSRKIEFDRASVPTNLLPLAPYAEFWGETDDGYRDDLTMKVPEDVLQNLKYAVKQFDDELDDWLAGPEASSRAPSDAYLAYSAMRIASDFIRRHPSQ